MFKRMLSTLHRRLGEKATFVAMDGSGPRQIDVLFDLQGGPMLDGAHLADEPSVRVAAAQVPGGVKRGDVFIVAGTPWRAREAGTALLDGAEFHVPLGRG